MGTTDRTTGDAVLTGAGDPPTIGRLVWGTEGLRLVEQSARVLVVDDNSDMCDLYAAYLSFQGMETKTAGDGAQALKQTAAFRPDLIVMDLMMPIMTGFEAIEQLKRDPATSGIPIIALTASHEPETKRAAQDACCDAFLTKPCQPDELLAQIRRLLRS
jgi:two-component system cell cycle response regulator DivK